MYWTCKLEDAYSSAECNKASWPKVECDVIWKVTACAHEGRKYEEGDESWTMAGNSRYRLLLKPE